MRFAFHRDTKGDTKKAIGLDMRDEKVDQVRVILWNLKGEKEVYEGEFGFGRCRKVADACVKPDR